MDVKPKYKVGDMVRYKFNPKKIGPVTERIYMRHKSEWVYDVGFDDDGFFYYFETGLEPYEVMKPRKYINCHLL